ncbi:MAG TPA: hypothetical protein VL426_01910 [Candidatus Binatia bacterium]|nr:hypothetical protein [Candidatus Binatia bacterium]
MDDRTDASLCNAMAFFDPKERQRPADLARAFAGEGGRVATLPDIIAARAAAPSEDVVWQRPFTTASAEYFGFSRAGVPLIAVAHGNGPLAEPEGPILAYVANRDGQRHARIPREEFLKVVDGACGDVAIIELLALHRLRRFPLLEMLTYEQACEDPLVRARLGEHAQAFLDRHRRISRGWLGDEDLTYRDNDCVLSLRDTPRAGYAALKDDGWAYAHLLDVSPLTDYAHGHWDKHRMHRSLVTELSLYDWGDRSGAIGIKGGGPIRRVHPGLGLTATSFSRLWRRLVRRATGQAPSLPLLRTFDGLWFSCHPGTGFEPGTAEPDRPVRQIAVHEDVRTFKMPIVNGDHQVLTFDHALVRAEAPEWADAYRIVQEARTVWEGDLAAYHVVKVEYVFADIEPDWGIPPARELERSFDLLLSLDERRAS